MKQLTTFEDRTACSSYHFLAERLSLEVRRPGRLLSFPPKPTNHDHRETHDRNCPGASGGSALAFVIPNRNKQQEQRDQDWESDHDVAFDPGWDEGEQREVPKKIPIRSWIGRQYARIRRPIQRRRSDEECGDSDRDDQARDDNHISPCQVRPKGLATLLEQFFIFRAVRCRIDRFACNRRLRDSVAKDEPHM